MSMQILVVINRQRRCRLGKEMILRWAGSDPDGLRKLKNGDTLDVYGWFFDRESAVEAANRDYKSGTGINVVYLKKDNEAVRKINVPVLPVYSEDYLGK
jgi:hypothetical protein